MDSIGRFVTDFLGRTLAWAAQNPGTALLIFVLIFVGLTVGFALKNANK